MKKLIGTITTAVLLFAFAVAPAMCFAQEQSYKEFMKERKELSKLTKDQLKERASKSARNEAKRLKKQGWQVAPGALPMDKQLDRKYEMELELDIETGFPKFIKGEAISIGANYDAAKMQAMNLAKIELAGNISTEVAALIESRVANNQLGPDEAVSTAESVMGAKNMIAQSIGRTITALEVYRETSNRNKEVRVVLLYNSEMAKAAAKKAIREDMTKKADKLVDQLDDILGF